MCGSIRVVSKRKGGMGAFADEFVIDVDRTNRLLGNPHELDNPKDPIARARCIMRHRTMVDKDFEVRGPIRKALLKIARRVYAGEKIALCCWCAPLQCHADYYVVWINRWLDYWRKRDAADRQDQAPAKVVRGHRPHLRDEGRRKR